MKINSQIVINKPVVMVWNFFDNPDKMGLWLTDFKKFEHVSGMKGHVGSKSRHFYNQNGKEFVLDEEITARQKYHHFAGKLTHQTMTADVDIIFKDLHDGRTQLDISNDISFTSFFQKLMLPLTSGKIRKRQEDDYQRLKAAVEAEDD